MSLPTAFWDSSAILPLCVAQIGSRAAEELFRQYAMSVWWAAPVEIASGLTRMQRMRSIGPGQFQAGKKLADDLARSWSMVRPSSAIAEEARSLLEMYPLSAADALRLAAALAWCEGKPKGQVFLTFDRRLREAAGLAGFTLL